MTKNTDSDADDNAIQDNRYARNVNDGIRRYRADGILFAYCDRDQHVIVSQGQEPATKWTKRVPAERSAVISGERLWTIPENWVQKVSVRGAAEARWAIFYIPETEVDVLVTVPQKNYLVDAWYGVKRVGALTVTYADEIDWNGLEESMDGIREIDAVDADVVEALEYLVRWQDNFERKFAEEVNMYAHEAVFERADEPVSVLQWTAEPWGDIFETRPLLQDFLDIDDETLDGVERHLSTECIIPSYPEVKVDVEKRVDIPEGYDIRALVEAGASAAEAVDYLVTQKYDLEPVRKWAEIRGKSSDSIKKNVRAGERTLSD